MGWVAAILAVVWAATFPLRAHGEVPVVEILHEADSGTPVRAAVETIAPLSTASISVEIAAAGTQTADDDSQNTPTVTGAPLLKLSEAVAAALEYSPGLQAMQWRAYAQWEQAQSLSGYGGLTAEFSILGMQTDSPLGVFAGKLSQGRVTQADFNPVALNDPGFLGNFEYKLRLLYPLFTSGRIELLAEALRLNSEAVDFDRMRAQNELTAKVIEVYFAHDLLTHQLLVLSDAQLTVDELKRLVESLEREGLVVKADVAAADVEVANIADELNQAQTNLQMTEDVLALLMGRQRQSFSSGIPLDPALLALPSLDDATQLAVSSRPDLLAMEKRMCAATNVLDEAIRKRNPIIGAFAEGKHATAGWPGDGHTEGTVGAQITLDLDTGGVIKHEIEQKRADLEAAKLGYQQLVQMAEIEVAQALNDAVKAQGSIQTFQSQGTKAAENLRVVRNRYREGLTNYLDVRMAVSTLKESRLRELNARYSFMLAYMRLLVATGQIGGAGDPFLSDSAGPPAVSPLALDEPAVIAETTGGKGNEQ